MVQIRVYFEDTDCGQIVYHTNYIKYCERARSELFFSNGVKPYIGDCGFVLSNIEAKFHTVARLGDLLEVRTHITQIKHSSLIAHQEIYRIYDALSEVDDECLVFSMDCLLAFVDTSKQKIIKIPPQMRTILEKYSKGYNAKDSTSY